MKKLILIIIISLSCPLFSEQIHFRLANNQDKYEFIKNSEFYFDTQYEIINYYRNGKCDKSKFTWPRHADGTCDYEDVSSVKTVSSSTTNVAPNKTMTVSENLKLRSGEATTSDVITVMSAGTKVKILELGKAENIDGINSNWVKVEVLSGVKTGTIGWCYGGYLE